MRKALRLGTYGVRYRNPAQAEWIATSLQFAIVPPRNAVDIGCIEHDHAMFDIHGEQSTNNGRRIRKVENVTDRGRTLTTFGGWESWDQARPTLTGTLPADAVDMLERAYEFARKYHAGQTRPAGEPYVIHLREVLQILLTYAGITRPDVLAAGLLHDVVEDTPCSIGAVANAFGSDVATLVSWVTIDPALSREEYHERLRSAPADALSVKLSDRYSNVQRLHTNPRVRKQRSYYQETREHILPLAEQHQPFAGLFAEWADAYDYLEQRVATVPAADKLAAALHRGQTDKSGSPYVGHVRAVADLVRRNGGTEAQQIAALLHDSVEDTGCTTEQLAELGVPTESIAFVAALTKRPGEPQPDYLTRLADTPDAVPIKRADIAHNLDPERLARLDAGTRDRLTAKYQTALDTLNQLHSS
jgi:hypothetical protein